MAKFDKDKIKAVSIRRILEAETGKKFVQRGSNEFIQCPLHDDNGPSLSVDEKKNEWYCHGACGSGGDTIKFIELHRNLNFEDACKHIADHYAPEAYDENATVHEGPKGKAEPGRKPPPQMPVPEGAIKNALDKALKSDWWVENYGVLTAAWKYLDAKGGVAYLDVRFEKLEAGVMKKQVVPMYYAKNGKWKMGIPFERLKQKRILFNLHELSRVKGKAALVVEGCKCASVNFPGLPETFILTTWPGGVNGIGKVDPRPLYGRRVVIWPDNDKPDDQWKRAGYAAAYYLGEMLDGKADVLMLKTAEHPKGKNTGKGYDIADYIEDGGDPIAYINNPENALTLDEVKDLAGLKTVEKDDMPHFKEVRKFTILKEPDSEVLLAMLDSLRRNKEGNVKRDDGNFLHITDNDPAFTYLVAYDRATNDIKYSDRYTELDELENQMWQYTQRHYSIAPTKTQRTDMLKTVAYRNSFNSLEVFLDELQTDMFEDDPVTFPANPLHELLGYMRFALEEEYIDLDEIRKLYTELFHKYFIRMFIKLEYIIRGELDNMPPADIVPILEGDQGIGKTRLCLLLSLEPTKFYVDMAELQLTNSRDTLAKIRGKLIGELGELAGLKRTELESIKAFISSTQDEMRRLYSENTVRSPRTVSFIGTTNEREYLRDTTGNRRFWPVRIEYVDHNVFREKQLIKKLYVYYRDKARTIINKDEVYDALLISDQLLKFAQYLREEKRVLPVFYDQIIRYIEDKEQTTFTEEPVKININKAASIIFDVAEERIQKFPPRFAPEFNRLLEHRGYKKKRGLLEGKECRYWQLDGRYCTGCHLVVDRVTKVVIDNSEKRLCNDCLEKNSDKVPEPF